MDPVETCLADADDPGAAAAWRRALSDLDGAPAIAVLGTDPARVGRLVRALAEARPEIRWVALPCGVGEDDDAEAAPFPEPLLGVHGALWVTSLPAPLGARERATLERVAPAAPERRALFLVGAELMGQIADDPEAEAAEVKARLQALAPEGWQVLDEVEGFASACAAERTALAAGRRRQVATLLLADAQARVRDALGREQARADALREALEGHEAALREARAKGRRVAIYQLAAMRRHGEELLIQLRDLLHRLDRELPDQVAPLSVAEARRVLPHWVDHVLAGFITDRLARWRLDVLADLDDAGIDAEAAERLELLAPTLHPGPLPGSGGWGARVLSSAALGGGAALLLFGWWIPGALVLAGGLLGPALAADEIGDREQLVEAARRALGEVSREAERTLRDQLDRAAAHLEELGEDRARQEAERRRADREDDEARHAFHRARAEALAAVRDDIARRLDELGAPEPTR